MKYVLLFLIVVGALCSLTTKNHNENRDSHEECSKKCRKYKEFMKHICIAKCKNENKEGRNNGEFMEEETNNNYNAISFDMCMDKCEKLDQVLKRVCIYNCIERENTEEVVNEKEVNVITNDFQNCAKLCQKYSDRNIKKLCILMCTSNEEVEEGKKEETLNEEVFNDHKIRHSAKEEVDILPIIINNDIH